VSPGAHVVEVRIGGKARWRGDFTAAARHSNEVGPGVSAAAARQPSTVTVLVPTSVETETPSIAPLRLTPTVSTPPAAARPNEALVPVPVPGRETPPRRWLWPVVGTSIAAVVIAAVVAGVVLGTRDAYRSDAEGICPGGGGCTLIDYRR
jgi:hypothetical protein